MHSVSLMSIFVCVIALSTAQAAEQSDLILEDLRAANEARRDMAQEADAWNQEKQRLQLLIQEAERQIKNQEAFIAENNKAIELIQKRLASLQNQTQHAAAIDALLIDLAQHIQQYLALRAKIVPSSAIEQPAQAEAVEASMQFLRAVAQLKQAAATSKQWRAHLSSGMLNGQRIAYNQLSMGHVAAWWLSRDQSQAGVIERRDGTNILHEIKDPAIVNAITRAVAIAHGDRAPEPVLLPIEQRQLTAAQDKELADE